MFDAILGKFVLFILGLIKPDNEANIQLFEDWNVVFRRKRAISVGHVEWS